LHAAFLAYGFGPGNEIIVPSFSFISTANSVSFVGAKPVFGDIEENTFGLDPKLIPQLISQKTKAIVPMDYGGISCKINEIQEVAKNNNLVLIEDSAEALGASINGKKVGSTADLSIFSFCGNKVLTTGEGGAIVTNDKTVFEKIKLIRSHGRMDTVRYFDNTEQSQYLELGYNWRMSSITAALGLSQISKLDKLIKMRQENAEYISKALSKFPEIITPSSKNGSEHIYQMYTIRLSNKDVRDKLHDFLTKKLIFSKVYFNPIHLTDFYRNKFGTKVNSLLVTELISQQILTIPLYPNMNLEEKKYLTDSISEFFDSV
jgi:dTDP-4-amino-4,6-dideoxygalactose transaminase